MTDEMMYAMRAAADPFVSLQILTSNEQTESASLTSESQRKEENSMHFREGILTSPAIEDPMSEASIEIVLGLHAENKIKRRPRPSFRSVRPGDSITKSRIVRQCSFFQKNGMAEELPESELSETMKLCRLILEDLMRKPEAFQFNFPVDPVKMNAMDYYEYVKKPMDFGTIMKHIQRGELSDNEQFYDLVMLVFKNAQVYNPVGHPIHLNALCLQEEFLEKYRSCDFEATREKSPERHFITPAKTKTSRTSPKGDLAHLSNSIKDLKRDLFRLSSDGRAQKRVVQPMEELSGEVTVEEKKQLDNRIKRLGENKIAELVALIKRREPEAVNSMMQNNVLELDLEKLSNPTLRAIQHLIGRPRRKTTGPPLRKTYVGDPVVAKQEIEHIMSSLTEIQTLPALGKKRRKGFGMAGKGVATSNGLHRVVIEASTDLERFADETEEEMENDTFKEPMEERTAQSSSESEFEDDLF